MEHALVRDLTLVDIDGSLNNMTSEVKKNLFDTFLARDRICNIEVIAGVPSTLWSFLFHSETKQTYVRHCFYETLHTQEFITGGDITRLMNCFFEILSKGIVYYEPKPDTVIFITYKVAYYANEFYCSAKGLTFVWLTLVDGSEYSDILPRHIVCFCGTQAHCSGLDAGSCIKNDLATELGEEAYLSGLPILKRIFSKIKDKVTICGHSLGGAIASMVAVTFQTQVRELIVYCAPGVRQFYHDKLKERFPIHIHVVKGDVVHMVSGKQLGYTRPIDYETMCNDNVFIYIYEIDKWLTIGYHTYFCISNPRGYDIKTKFSRNVATLDTLYSPTLEFCRWIASYINEPIIGLGRSISRSLFPSRAEGYRYNNGGISYSDELLMK